MTPKALIARAAKGLLDILALLLRGVGAMSAVIWSFFAAMVSSYEPETNSSEGFMGEYDPMKPAGSEGRRVSHSQAEEYGYDNW
jgi:hypothetical protein